MFEQFLKEEKGKDQFSKSTPSTQEPHTGKSLRNREAQKIKVVEARGKGDRNITCGGAVYLMNGSLVLLDTVYNCCCQYDHSLRYMREFKLSSKPHSVTDIGQDRIAVSLPEENMIQVLNVRDGITCTRNVYTDWPCYALASAGDDKIVVCYEVKHKPEVVMINLDGDKKCTLYTSSSSGSSAAQVGIAYDKLRKRTCVAEGNSTVMCVILKDGTERFRYFQESSFLDPVSSFCNGIDYDHEGNLYFITQHNGINQVSVNGDLLQHWTFNSPSPAALCFCPYGHDFVIVTTSGEVHYFSLKQII
ncbi:hypothetical protein ACJMK2_010408 [Sinanodonta woodiana]|uniref:Uncharacterized protein n=1 Tax=Sinanodonta woodiana TaxID=1069815 RepID=A0ABD3VGI3_SINWO